jgi:Periplasmic protease
MARTGDSHVSALSSVLGDVLGKAPAPVRVRSVEEKPVVTRVVDSAVAETTAVDPGDVILEVDGTPAEVRRDSLARFGRAASTPQARRYQTASNLLDGPPGSTATVRVRKPDGSKRLVNLPRLSREDYDPHGGDTEKPVLRRLTERIGYADLDRLARGRVDSMFARFSDTDAIVFDMRGYPKGTAWAIAPAPRETPRPVAASFAKPLRLGPGEVGRQTIEFDQHVPPRRRGSRYAGETVMLMDARTISQAEHTGLFLKAANGTTFIGSPTRGANGDITRFRLPGGITARFTGQGVRHPDGTQLQRRGLQPDVEVHPTIESVRRGDDVVLQKAIEHLQTTLGSGEP